MTEVTVEIISYWKETKRRVTCGFCEEKMVDPRGLPCFHNFCLSCLVYFGKYMSDVNHVMPCPVCREPFQIPEGGFEGMMEQFRVKAFLEIYHKFLPLATRDRLGNVNFIISCYFSLTS